MVSAALGPPVKPATPIPVLLTLAVVTVAAPLAPLKVALTPPVTVPPVLSTVTVPPDLWANTPPDVTSCVVTLTAPVPCATALIPSAPETVPFAVTVRAPLPLRISALIAVLVAVPDPVVILIGPLVLWAEMPVPLDVIVLPSPLICSVLVAFGILTALPKAGWMVTPGATFSVCVFAPL